MARATPLTSGEVNKGSANASFVAYSLETVCAPKSEHLSSLFDQKFGPNLVIFMVILAKVYIGRLLPKNEDLADFPVKLKFDWGSAIFKIVIFTILADFSAKIGLKADFGGVFWKCQRRFKFLAIGSFLKWSFLGGLKIIIGKVL